MPKAESLYLQDHEDDVKKRLRITVPEGAFYLRRSLLKATFDRRIICLCEQSLSYSHSKPGSFRLTGSLRGSGIFSIAVYPESWISSLLSCYPVRKL